MAGVREGKTGLANEDCSEEYKGRKVIIAVLDDEKQFDTISDGKLFTISDSLINQNMDAYQELAK